MATISNEANDQIESLINAPEIYEVFLGRGDL